MLTFSDSESLLECCVVDELPATSCSSTTNNNIFDYFYNTSQLMHANLRQMVDTNNKMLPGKYRYKPARSIAIRYRSYRRIRAANDGNASIIILITENGAHRCKSK
jgi:hypothetical protein